MGTWPGARKLFANSLIPPVSILLQISLIFEIVNALSKSVIPV